MFLTNGLYLEDKQMKTKSQFLKKKSNNPIKVEWTFHRRYTNGQEANIFNILRYHFLPSIMAKTKKTDNMKCL